jgi:TonB-like protein
LTLLPDAQAAGMTTALLALDDPALRRAHDRRVSIAIGASLVIHALTIAMLRGLMPPIYASPQASAGSSSTLQAILAGPKSEHASAEPKEIDMPVEPELLLPPAAKPVASPIPRPPPPTGPLPGDNPAGTGPSTPEIRIALRTIDDPAALGPEYVVRVAQRFPVRAGKPPMLLGSPAVMYPPAAVESHAERRVAVLLTLRADGSIAESQLIPEDPLFGPPVLDALKSTQFAPAEVDGKPVPYWAIVEFVFSLGRPSAGPVADRGYGRSGTTYPGQPSVGR